MQAAFVLTVVHLLTENVTVHAAPECEAPQQSPFPMYYEFPSARRTIPAKTVPEY